MNAHRVLNPEMVPSRERTRAELHLIHSDPKSAKRRWSDGNLFLALMVASLGLFAVALATFVVDPAVTTVTSASVEAWIR